MFEVVLVSVKPVEVKHLMTGLIFSQRDSCDFRGRLNVGRRELVVQLAHHPTSLRHTAQTVNTDFPKCTIDVVSITMRSKALIRSINDWGTGSTRLYTANTDLHEEKTPRILIKKCDQIYLIFAKDAFLTQIRSNKYTAYFSKYNRSAS